MPPLSTTSVLGFCPSTVNTDGEICVPVIVGSGEKHEIRAHKSVWRQLVQLLRALDIVIEAPAVVPKEAPQPASPAARRQREKSFDPCERAWVRLKANSHMRMKEAAKAEGISPGLLSRHISRHHYDEARALSIGNGRQQPRPTGAPVLKPSGEIL